MSAQEPPIRSIPQEFPIVQTNSTKNSALQAALHLLERGFWPCLIYPPGIKRRSQKKLTNGKEPVGNGWGAAQKTEADLRGLVRWAKSNEGFTPHGCGVCLGPGRAPGGGWLIDLEGDGERAQESLETLFSGKIPPTRGWASARGKHHLFTADGERFLKLLAAAGAVEGKGHESGKFTLPDSLPDLELRIGGYKPDDTVKQFQSVAPPTLGTDGKPRVWNGVESIAELPEIAYEAIKEIAEAVANKREERAAIQEADQLGVAEGPLTGGNGRVRAPVATSPDAFEQAANELEKATPASSGHRDHYNDRCHPPWSESELKHKAEDACKRKKRRDLPQAPRIDKLNDKGTSDSISTQDNTTMYNRPGISSCVQSKQNTPLKIVTQETEVMSAAKEVDTRPEIVISTQEHKVIDKAVAALTAEADLFQRGGSLVTILTDCKPQPKRHEITRPPGSLRIILLPNPQLRRMMCIHANWRKGAKSGDGSELAPAHPPDWAVKGVATMGNWPGLRPLEGITEAPTMRADGSLIDQAGYDHDTGLWFAPSGDFPAIPENPTKEQAVAAVAELLALVEDFPFPNQEHKATWLAALLTALARPAIDGPCPLFLFDANCAGAGKTKLCDIISILATGRVMARGAYPDDNVEMEKVILSIAMAGDRFVLFDNVPTGGAIGGPALDRALTGQTWKGRPLGRTDWTPELPLNCLFFATGNNLGLRGDALRRVVACRLETPEDRPEERTGFKIPDLLAHVKENRGRLVAQGLTILSGYIVAGRPDPGLTPMDFTAWSGLIRNAVHWAYAIDPCETRKQLVADDEEANTLKALMRGWQSLCGIRNETAMTAAAALKAIDLAPSGNAELQALRDVFMSWSNDDRLPSAKTVGKQLGKRRGRPCDGKCLERGGRDVAAWYVKAITKP